MSLRVEEGIGYLVMEGEGKFNPVSLAAFNKALDQVLADDSCQGLIVTGTDKNFAQGLDLEFLYSAGADQAIAFVQDCMRMVGRLLQFPVPVTAAVNGHAFGLGCMIVLACDYTVMRNDRGFLCLPEVDLGMTLIPSMNALVTEKLEGTVLRDLLLTGKRMGGAEAAERGVIDACGELDGLIAQGLQLMQPMLGKDRNTLAGLKADINRPILRAIETA